MKIFFSFLYVIDIRLYRYKRTSYLSIWNLKEELSSLVALIIFTSQINITETVHFFKYLTKCSNFLEYSMDDESLQSDVYVWVYM